MKTTVEPVEGNKVKLSIEVDENEFEPSIDAAFRKIAREVRIPGFRPGKAPRRVVEARFGAGAGRVEALRDSLPDFYARAVREQGVDVIAAPEIDITAGEDSGPVVFDAVVEIRPRLDLVGYQGLRATVPKPVVTDEDVEAQVDRLRSNLAELQVVERPARDGDNLTIDLAASRDGQPVAGLSSTDFMYELGSGSVLVELDVRLQGAKPGDIVTFDAELPDGTVSLRVLVKQVQEKILPEPTDEWASDASEMATVAELRADIRRRLEEARKLEAMQAWHNGTLAALIELVDSEPPEPLVQEELERRAHDFAHRLDLQGISIVQYMKLTGQDEQVIVAGLRAEAVPAVKADLALRAVAEAESLEVTPEELDAELSRLARAYRQRPDRLRASLESNGQMPAVVSDVRKSKAFEWLLERVELVDPDGQPVDRSLLARDRPGEPRETDPTSSGHSDADTDPTAEPESGES
jgi:trigger factor